MMVVQLGLLDQVARTDAPRKRVRAVSRQIYAELRDGDRLSKQQHVFLTALAAYINRWQVPPTVAELTAWAYADGRLPRNDPNLLRPRATELSAGERRRQPDGTWTHRGGGVVELLPRRLCRVTQRMAHPLRIRERGSQEAR